MGGGGLRSVMGGGNMCYGEGGNMCYGEGGKTCYGVGGGVRCEMKLTVIETKSLDHSKKF